MNTEKPHDIIDLEALLAKPKNERQKYRQLSEKEAPTLREMNVGQRADWLESNPLTDFDRARIAKAEAKRARKAATRLSGKGEGA